MATFVIANTKGGVGKTIISHMVLPTLFLEDDKTINVYEIDDNNKTSLKNKSEKLNFKSIRIKEMEDDIDQVKMDTIINDENVINIIDCGGGNDTLIILDHLAKNDMQGLLYIIPTNDDMEQFENVKQTLETIRSFDPGAKTIVVFNRANSITSHDVQKQFIGFFGSIDYGIEAKLSKIEHNIDETFALLESNLYGILKNVYKTTLADIYPNLKYTVENSRTLQETWAKDGKEVFLKNMKYFRFAKDTLALVETIKPLKKIIQKAISNE
jgi:cellulose biosynthesis protein BcsQ